METRDQLGGCYSDQEREMIVYDSARCGAEQLFASRRSLEARTSAGVLGREGQHGELPCLESRSCHFLN